MTPEKSAVERFIRACPSHWHVQKIETNMASGVPDLSVAMTTEMGKHQQEFWVEMKAGKNPDIRPFQVAWWHKRVRAGGRVWVIWIQPKQWSATRISAQVLKRLSAEEGAITIQKLTQSSVCETHTGTALSTLIWALENYN